MLDVGGTLFAVDPKFIEEYPDSSLEAILSGRHENKNKDGHPFIDRDPEIFERTMQFLENQPLDHYQKISEEM